MDALNRLQVAFMSAPVLGPQLGVELSLPTEPGFGWTWVELEGKDWSVLSAEGLIRKHQLAPVFGAQAGTVWSALLNNGWLEYASEGSARIVPKDRRTQPNLPTAYARIEEVVELLFHQLRIRPFDPTPRFDRPHVLKEGWLVLKPQNS